MWPVGKAQWGGKARSCGEGMQRRGWGWECCLEPFRPESHRLPYFSLLTVVLHIILNQLSLLCFMQNRNIWDILP